jgi:hypothetical protein
MFRYIFYVAVTLGLFSEYSRELAYSLIDKTYMLDKSPGTAQCPFAGGDIYRHHEDVVGMLSTLPSRLANGSAIRGNVLGSSVFARSIHHTPMSDPNLDRHYRNIQALKLVLQTSLERMQNTETWHDIERGFLTPHVDLFVWWNSVFWKLLGMGHLSESDSRSLHHLRIRLLLGGAFLPDWGVFGYLVSDKQVWIERIGQYFPNLAESVFDTIVFSGGLAIPRMLTAGVGELQTPGRAHPNTETVEAFVYETLRVHAPVGTIAYFVAGTNRRQMLSLRAAALDPDVWGPRAREFDPKPLDMYLRNFVGFAEPAGSMVCPGKAMTMQVLQRLFLAYTQCHFPIPAPPPRMSFVDQTLMDVIHLQIRCVSEDGHSITAHTITDMMRVEERPFTSIDLGVQWAMSSLVHLMDKEVDQPLLHLRASDIWWMLATRVAHMARTLSPIVSPVVGDRRRRLLEARLGPSNPNNMTILDNNMDLLEYGLNNLWVGDITHRINTFKYEIRTEFLNGFEHHNPKQPSGGVIGVTCNAGSFHIVEVRYLGIRYDREHVPEYVLSRIAWGLLAHMTIGPHLMDTHIIMGFQRVRHIRKYLPLTHPVRRLLLPTETGSIQNSAMAVFTLMTPSAAVDTAFPYTFAGLRAMVDTYTPSDIPERVPHAVFRDVYTWRTYIASHMKKIVRSMYPCDIAIRNDTALGKWLGNDKPRRVLEKRLTDIFMAGVHHSFMSSPYTVHFARMATILDPEPVDVESRIEMITVFIQTDSIYIPMDADFSALNERRDEVAEFYRGMRNLTLFHPRAYPGDIQQSCGST